MGFTKFYVKIHMFSGVFALRITGYCILAEKRPTICGRAPHGARELKCLQHSAELLNAHVAPRMGRVS